MYILPKIKRLAAFSVAILLTLGAMGLNYDENMVATHAAKNNEQYSQKLNDLSEQQKDLQEKIANADSSIKAQQEMLNNVADQMNVISEKIKTSEKYSKQIEDDICKLDEKMRKTQNELTKKETEIKKNVNGFMKRVRAMYITGTDSYASILAESGDFYEVLMRTELIKKVAEHDNDTIAKLIEQKKAIDKEKSDLEKQSKELKKNSTEYAKQQKALASEYQNLVGLQETYGESIAAMQNDKSQYQSEINAVIDEYHDIAALAQAQADVEEDTAPAATTKAAASKTTGAKARTTAKAAAKTTVKKAAATTTRKAAVTTRKATTTAAPVRTTRRTTTTTAAPTYSYDSSYNSKIDILMSTARSMVGGAYVWGGSSPRATDCSGLTMQCYAKIGIYLPHLASAQAGYGTSVSYNNMQKGDLIFFGGSSYSSIYHVAIYIGDGKMIHAENSYTGIVVSYVSSFSQYNNITCIKRLL